MQITAKHLQLHMPGTGRTRFCANDVTSMATIRPSNFLLTRAATDFIEVKPAFHSAAHFEFERTLLDLVSRTIAGLIAFAWCSTFIHDEPPCGTRIECNRQLPSASRFRQRSGVSATRDASTRSPPSQSERTGIQRRDNRVDVPVAALNRAVQKPD